MNPEIPSFNHVVEAYRLIREYIHKTPVITSESINRITGGTLYFKCENFQKAGAFKYRGATHAILRLTGDEARRGVATHSSGNHAAALAKAAALQGIKAYIVMPENAPGVKQAAVRSYGAGITFCHPTLQARETTLSGVIEKTGATFIHPYDNVRVICGQGTAALEFLEQIQDPDIIVAPVGGGGLMSGTAIVTHHLSKKTKIIGAEPERADDACRSLLTGKLQPALPPQTIADGLLTALSERTFHILSKYVDQVLTTSEENIIRAMRLLWERAKIIVEPSAAVPLAVVLQHRKFFEGKSTGIILSGGNIDLSNLPFNPDPAQ